MLVRVAYRRGVSLILRLVATVALALPLAACAGTPAEEVGEAQVFAPEAAPGDPGASEGSGDESVPDDGTPAERSACDLVVAGIEAFNRGEPQETVARFEEAVPLAEAEDEAAGTQASADLLEAVQYYAELPAEDYLAASAGSPDFARYKAITLGLCGSGEPQVPGQPDDEGGVQA